MPSYRERYPPTIVELPQLADRGRLHRRSRWNYDDPESAFDFGLKPHSNTSQDIKKYPLRITPHGTYDSHASMTPWVPFPSTHLRRAPCIEPMYEVKCIRPASSAIKSAYPQPNHVRGGGAVRISNAEHKPQTKVRAIECRKSKIPCKNTPDKDDKHIYKVIGIATLWRPKKIAIVKVNGLFSLKSM